MALWSRCSRLVAILLLCLFAVPVGRLAAQDAVDARCAEARELSYNFKLDAARAVYDEVIRDNPADPRGYYGKSTLYLWRYLGSNKSADYAAFLSLSDSALALADDRYASGKDKFRNALLLGMNYGWRALAFGKKEKYLDMIWASQKSNSYLGECRKLDPKNADAALGIGLFKFALSQVPPAFKWALTAVGFSGDIREGVALIKLAAQQGTLVRVEAQYYYSAIITDYFNDYAAAAAVLAQLQEKYPGNILFTYGAAVLNLKKRDMPAAVSVLNRMLRSQPAGFEQLYAYASFLMGDAFFRQNQFARALPYYQRFLASAPSRDYRGIAALRAGIAAWSLGNQDSARRCWQKAGTGNAALDEDAYAARKGAAYLASGISREEALLLRYRNLLEAGQFALAADSLKLLGTTAIDKSVSAVAQAMLAEALLEAGNTAGAASAAAAVVRSGEQHEPWVLPRAALIAAWAYYRAGNKAMALEFAGKAEELNDFEFPAFIKQKVAAVRALCE